jgi:hypothetical protein
MLGITQRRFGTLDQFESAWMERVEVPAVIKELGNQPQPEIEVAFQGAVHFIAGFLRQLDFKLFRNGGLPLIERITGPSREEILVRLAPNAVRGTYIPIQIQIHMTHSDLRTIRERYWPGAGRPPVSLFSGNLGLLQEIPTYDIWNVATEDAFSEVTEHLREYLIPFLEVLENPRHLKNLIFNQEFRVFDPVTSLEWILLHYGSFEARAYLQKIIDESLIPIEGFWNAHDGLREQTQVSYQPGNMVRNLAAVALTHDLTRRWLR